MMTSELEEELTIHRGGKKVDLELKSDFEAVMAKCSGLHFMLSKVNAKLGDIRILTDKNAAYIRNTKACLEKSIGVVNLMFKRVEAHEERRSSLWASMGVSKEQRTGRLSEAEGEADFFLDIDDTYSEDDPLSPASPLSSATLSPQTVTSTGPSPPPSQPLPESSDTAIAEKSQTTVRSSSSLAEKLLPQKLPLSLPLLRSVSPQAPAEIEPLEVMDLSQGKSVSISIRPPSSSMSLVAKRARQDSVKEKPGHESTYVQSKSRKMGPAVADTIVMDEDVKIIGYSPSSGAVPSHSTSRTHSAPLIIVASDGAQISDSESVRRKDRPLHRRQRQERPKTVGGREKRQAEDVFFRRSLSLSSSPQLQLTLSEKPDAVGTTDSQNQGRSVEMHSATVTSFSPSLSPPVLLSGSPLASDVTVDGPEDDLDKVEAILEDSWHVPTVSMYTEDVGEMDQLAEMTQALSCEDLSPSVMESVMGDLPIHPVAPVTTAARHSPKPPRSSAASRVSAHSSYVGGTSRSLGGASALVGGTSRPAGGASSSVGGAISSLVGTSRSKERTNRPDSGSDLSKAIAGLSGDLWL